MNREPGGPGPESGSPEGPVAVGGDGEGLLRVGPRGLRGAEALGGMGDQGVASWAVGRQGVRGVQARRCREEVRDPRGSRPVRGAQGVGRVEGRGEWTLGARVRKGRGGRPGEWTV